MASVYILFSKKLNSYYTGSCRDLDIRLEEHKSKKFKKSFTARADDWQLMLSIDDLEYAQARQIEKYIKRMKSRIYIEQLLKDPDRVDLLIDAHTRWRSR